MRTTQTNMYAVKLTQQSCPIALRMNDILSLKKEAKKGHPCWFLFVTCH